MNSRGRQGRDERGRSVFAAGLLRAAFDTGIASGCVLPRQLGVATVARYCNVPRIMVMAWRLVGVPPMHRRAVRRLTAAWVSLTSRMACGQVARLLAALATAEENRRLMRRMASDPGRSSSSPRYVVRVRT